MAVAPIQHPPPHQNPWSFARESMEEYGDDVDLAAAAMVEALKAPALWNEIGEGVLLAGCKHLCRTVRSRERGEIQVNATGTGVTSAPEGHESGKALLKAFGMTTDPFDWIVPYLGKKCGDCTPEELLSAAAECKKHWQAVRHQEQRCKALAALGEKGKPLRESITAEQCREVISAG